MAHPVAKGKSSRAAPFSTVTHFCHSGLMDVHRRGTRPVHRPRPRSPKSSAASFFWTSSGSPFRAKLLWEWHWASAIVLRIDDNSALAPHLRSNDASDVRVSSTAVRELFSSPLRRFPTAPACIRSPAPGPVASSPSLLAILGSSFEQKKPDSPFSYLFPGIALEFLFTHFVLKNSFVIAPSESPR